MSSPEESRGFIPWDDMKGTAVQKSDFNWSVGLGRGVGKGLQTGLADATRGQRLPYLPAPATCHCRPALPQVRHLQPVPPHGRKGAGRPPAGGALVSWGARI